MLHLLLFASVDDRCLRLVYDSIWTNLHRISMLSWNNGPTTSSGRIAISLELLLAHNLGMKIISHMVIWEALCSHAVYGRIVLTVGVWIRDTLKLGRLLLKRIAQVSPLLLLDVSHFSKHFLFTGYIIKNLHSIIDHPAVILHVETLSLRILRACNATILRWLLLHQFWWLLDIWRRSVTSILHILVSHNVAHICHGRILTPIKRLEAIALGRKSVRCYLSSLLPTILLNILPLLLDLNLMLVWLQIILKLLMLRHLRIIYVRSVRSTILLYLFLNSLRYLLLMILVVTRNYTFSRIHTVCGLKWTSIVDSGRRVHR